MGCSIPPWIGGEKTIYNCIKGDSQRLNSIVELSRCPSDEPTGIEVCIPIKQDMMWRLHREAADYLKYWAELPTIVNMDNGSNERMMKFRNTPATLQGEGWNIRPRCDGTAIAVAFMGGVSYRMSDGIPLMLGYAFAPGNLPNRNWMKIGYSFDIMTNPLNIYGKGTHELMLNYCLFPPPPVVPKHGNPFILQ